VSAAGHSNNSFGRNPAKESRAVFTSPAKRNYRVHGIPSRPTRRKIKKRSQRFSLNARRRREIEWHAKHVRPNDLSKWLIAWIWHNTAAKDQKWSLMECARRLGWKTIQECDALELLERADRLRGLMKADALGGYLQVSYAARQELGIRTIGAYDVNKRTRTLLRKRKKRAAMAAKRRANGARPHSESLSATQPWRALNVSRSTWYERRWTNSYPIALRNVGHESVRVESQQEDFRARLRLEGKKEDFRLATAITVAVHECVLPFQKLPVELRVMALGLATFGRENLSRAQTSPNPIPSSGHGLTDARIIRGETSPYYLYVSSKGVTWAVAVLVGTIPRESSATCNVRGLTFMHWPARES
jgi:hypothetical protein